MKFENDATTASGCTTPRFAQRQAACGKWTLLNISRSTTALVTSWWASKTGNSVITSLWALIDSQVWTKRGCWNNTHTELRKWTLIDCDNAKLLPITILSIFFYCLPRAGASALITRARARITRACPHTHVTPSHRDWYWISQGYTHCAGSSLHRQHPTCLQTAARLRRGQVKGEECRRLYLRLPPTGNSVTVSRCPDERLQCLTSLTAHCLRLVSNAARRLHLASPAARRRDLVLPGAAACASLRRPHAVGISPPLLPACGSSLAGRPVSACPRRLLVLLALLLGGFASHAGYSLGDRHNPLSPTGQKHIPSCFLINQNRQKTACSNTIGVKILPFFDSLTVFNFWTLWRFRAFRTDLVLLV